MRRKEKTEGFACGGHPRCERFERHALEGAEGCRRNRVVEADSGAGWKLSDGAQCAAKSRWREVGNYAEPAEESWTCGIEAGGSEAVGKGVMFEVEGNEGERCGDGDVSFCKHGSLIGLGGWEVDLEDPE